MGDLIEEVLDVDTADGEMAVVVKRPADGAHPLVVVLMDAPGIRDALHVYTRRLADEGYVVALLDLYHRHGRMIGYGPAEAAADPEVRPRIMSLLATVQDDQVQSDVDDAITALGELASSPAGCIGFCMGARHVYRLMNRLPEQFVAGAMWHPSFLVDDGDDSPHRSAAAMPGALYVGQGEADQVMSLELNTPFFEAAQTRDEHTVVNVFEGADHGFTWPDSPAYHEEAAETSWSETLSMFADALR